MDKNILKYFSEELSQDEKELFLQQVENDNNLKKEFIYIQNIYSISQLSNQSSDKSEGKKSFDKFIQSATSRQRRNKLQIFLKYAAIIAILITTTILSTLYLNEKSSDSLLNTIYVPAGQRTRITLQDGTEVWLNAHTTFTYPSKFSRKSRNVEIKGEAFFDVAKDNKRPFTVNTQHVKLEVLGTQFNIYSDSDYAETVLVEGSLKVTDKLNKNTSVVLKPNEQVYFENGKLSVSQNLNTDYPLWRKGIYSFNEKKLIEIIQKLELYYDVKIKIEDPEIFNVTYTGKFRQRDGIDEILSILQIIQPFKINKDRENNIITLSK